MRKPLIVAVAAGLVVLVPVRRRPPSSEQRVKTRRDSVGPLSLRWGGLAMPRSLILASLALLGVLVLSACGGDDAGDEAATTTTVGDQATTTTALASDAPTSGPVTIEAAADFSTRPVVGTFEVTEGADVLGCSNGTYEDTFDEATEDVSRLMTCSGPNTGTFTIVFDPDGYDTGPGENNGPWRIVSGSADFADLRGEGDFWMTPDGPDTGVEEYTGDIEYTS